MQFTIWIKIRVWPPVHTKFVHNFHDHCVEGKKKNVFRIQTMLWLELLKMSMFQLIRLSKASETSLLFVCFKVRLNYGFTSHNRSIYFVLAMSISYNPVIAKYLRYPVYLKSNLSLCINHVITLRIFLTIVSGKYVVKLRDSGCKICYLSNLQNSVIIHWNNLQDYTFCIHYYFM